MSFKAIWANNTPYSKFLISVGIILLSAVLFTLISTLLAGAFYGVSMEQMAGLMNDLSNSRNIEVLKLVQTVSAIGTFIVPPIILAWLFHMKPFHFLSVDRKPEILPLLLIALLLIIAVPFINYLGALNEYFSLPSSFKAVEEWMKSSEEQAAKLTEAFLKMSTPGELFFNLIMIALIPAIGEELLFRGIIQNIFSSWLKSKHAGVWLSAILFSAMHMQFYGFIPRLMLGVMLGYLLVWSGNLWWPVFAHFVNNAAAVLFAYLFQNQLIQFNADTIGTQEGDSVSLAISVFATGVLLYSLYLRGQKKRLLSEE